MVLWENCLKTRLGRLSADLAKLEKRGLQNMDWSTPTPSVICRSFFQCNSSCADSLTSSDLFLFVNWLHFYEERFIARALWFNFLKETHIWNLTFLAFVLHLPRKLNLFVKNKSRFCGKGKNMFSGLELGCHCVAEIVSFASDHTCPDPSDGTLCRFQNWKLIWLFVFYLDFECFLFTINR